MGSHCLALSLCLSVRLWPVCLSLITFEPKLMLTADRKARAQRYLVLTKYNAWRKSVCSTSSTALTSLLSTQAHGSARVWVPASTAPLSLSGRGSYHQEQPIQRRQQASTICQGCWRNSKHWSTGNWATLISSSKTCQLLTCNSQQLTVASQHSFWKNTLENHTFPLKLYQQTLFKSSCSLDFHNFAVLQRAKNFDISQW